MIQTVELTGTIPLSCAIGTVLSTYPQIFRYSGMVLLLFLVFSESLTLVLSADR